MKKYIMLTALLAFAGCEPSTLPTAAPTPIFTPAPTDTMTPSPAS